jgi:hypothetical protein
LLERPTANTEVATVLGSFPASSGTVESAGRHFSSVEFNVLIKPFNPPEEIPLLTVNYRYGAHGYLQ